MAKKAAKGIMNRDSLSQSLDDTSTSGVIQQNNNNINTNVENIRITPAAPSINRTQLAQLEKILRRTKKIIRTK